MPSSPCEPNELKFGMWVSITNLTIFGGNGLNLKNKLFLNNPNVQSLSCTRILFVGKGGVESFDGNEFKRHVHFN